MPKPALKAVQSSAPRNASSSLRHENRPPARRDGGGGDNGDMEARIAKLESGMEYVLRELGEIKADIREVKRDARTDFRVTWAALIAGFLGIAGLMAKGFGWL